MALPCGCQATKSRREKGLLPQYVWEFHPEISLLEPTDAELKGEVSHSIA
jgi:hypothetical protein